MAERTTPQRASACSRNRPRSGNAPARWSATIFQNARQDGSPGLRRRKAAKSPGVTVLDSAQASLPTTELRVSDFVSTGVACCVGASVIAVLHERVGEMLPLKAAEEAIGSRDGF